MLKASAPFENRPLMPPLAEAEPVESDDAEARPQPGVDDGFFTPPEAGGAGPARHDHGTGTDDDPLFEDRAGPEGDSDEADGKRAPSEPESGPPPRYPYAPSFGFDLEGGVDGSTLVDVNVYQHKKTLAQGMMDLALFSANANQLRYVLETFNEHPYYYPSLVLISISLIFQVAVGIGLIWNAAYNVKDKKQICTANRINNFTVIGIFLVTVVNVFVSAFGVAPPPPNVAPAAGAT